MRVLGIALAVLAVLALDAWIAREFYKVASMKGWPRKRYFWFSFLLPIAGWVLVAALPDRGAVPGTEIVSKKLPEL